MKIWHFVATFIAILVGAYIIPGVSVTPVSALVLAVLLGVINVFVRPIILLLTLPITLFTLGLFALVINALILMGLAQVVPDFHLAGFLTAVLFSIVISLVSAFFGTLIKNT